MPDIPRQRLDAIAVKRNDIDLYHHMNNVKYVEVALELLPMDFVTNRLRIEYKKPAKLGDQLYPQIIKAPPAHLYILLLDSQDNPYVIMEFSQDMVVHIDDYKNN
ncbi:hypothetical protein SDC9_123429 [bioreactor metagenome]|uniref:Acyl-ACP thioesterase-like C-terminal domain-containing protein n=1 Tax=bioreactor metagenome TaxID=1076179 RepID=A0A645CHN2_9ZZZZ